MYICRVCNASVLAVYLRDETVASDNRDVFNQSINTRQQINRHLPAPPPTPPSLMVLSSVSLLHSLIFSRYTFRKKRRACVRIVCASCDGRDWLTKAKPVYKDYLFSVAVVDVVLYRCAPVSMFYRKLNRRDLESQRNCGGQCIGRPMHASLAARVAQSAHLISVDSNCNWSTRIKAYNGSLDPFIVRRQRQAILSAPYTL